MSVEDLLAESQPRIADVFVVNGRNHVLLQQTVLFLNENPKVFRIDCLEALKGSLTLVFKLKTGGGLDSNIVVGEVRANIKEMLNQIEGGKSYFTYPITGTSGEVIIGILKFSVEFKELMMALAHFPNGPTLADSAGPSAGTPYMGPTHPQGYVGLSHPTPPPYPAPQPRLPSIVRRFTTHLGLTYLVDLINNNGNGWDFNPEFGDIDSLF